MNAPTSRFGWNLRTLNVVLFCGGLLTFAVLRIGLALQVLSWPWQVWAALIAGGIAVSLLIAGAWQLANCVRRRRWKTLGAVVAAAAAACLGLLLLRNALIPWTTIEGRVIDDKTAAPLAGVTVRVQMTNASQGSTRTLLADERLMLAWLLSSGGEALTDEQGRYRFRALPLGAYNVWAEQQGRTGPAIDSLAGNRSAATVAPDLRLGPGGVVKGRIIDAATGQLLKLERPIPWADTVLFYGPARPKSGGAVESAPIQPDGTFALRAPPGLNYLYLNLTCDARAVEITPVKVQEGETVEVELFVHNDAAEPPAAK
jgi:hypothetical protein